MGGVRLIAHFPLSAIVHGMGLNVTVVSCDGQVVGGTALDPSQIDDTWGLGRHRRDAQAEHYGLVSR